MIGWSLCLIFLGLLLVASFLKVRLDIVYRSSIFEAKLLVGELKIPLRKSEELIENNVASTKGKKGKSAKRSMKPWIRAAMDSWQDIISLFGRILTAPTLEVLRLQVEVGEKEPDRCALKYGRVCSLVGALLAPVENTFEVKKRCVDVRCCFDRADLNIDAEAILTLRVYEIVVLAAAVLKLGFGLYRQAKSNMKVV